MRAPVALALFVDLLASCRRHPRVDARADPAATASASSASADAAPLDAPPFAGELVAAGGARVFDIDAEHVRWASPSEVQNEKHELYDFFEARHTDVLHAQPLPIGDESPLYVDARWIVTWVYGFNRSDLTFIHDRATGTSRSMTLPCAPGGAVADATRGVLVGICDWTTHARSDVYVFDPTSGDVRPWFVVPYRVYPVALDAANLYYATLSELRVRSRITNADVVVMRDFSVDHSVLSGGDAFECVRVLVRRPLDGSPAIELSARCERIAGDADGIAFTSQASLFALDRGETTPRLVVAGVRGRPRALAIGGGWIYFQTDDGLRRIPRR